MNEERVEPESVDERRARDAIRSLPPATAAAAFRARLKQDFVTGRVGEPRALSLGAGRAARRFWTAALAAIAVVAVVAVLPLANRPPRWTMVEAVDNGGVAVVDQVPVPVGQLAEQSWRLRAGARVRLPAGARLELASADLLVLEIEGGSEVTMPGPPPRWFGRTVAASVETGVLRVATGPRFRGARLRVFTPEVEVTVMGTALAVIREPAGTCVCVHDGEVMVGARGAAGEPVPAGRRRFVFNDGRPPETAEMRPGERERLGAIQQHRHHPLDGDGR